MARIRLALPAQSLFQLTLPIRIQDINYGGHLSNSAILGLAHEARIAFLAQYGWQELNIEGCGIIMADAAIQFRAEAFHGEVLNISVGLMDAFEYGCDMFYRMVRESDGKEIALVKTALVFFDYSSRSKVAMPAAFASLIPD
ncbi:thioesterase family protein [Pokkaliibacter sp. MBI-7]|uniref:thioesterase family protein n=1 Tax=Pokkaliibacter sp. MBI-7 TaxID=3040600 RepID=UPI00244CBB2F|nr:thioesterase family protein [Pokkaliibacter sp. MBI-7]MDH2432198.1 thioesterase family protein [Pokkaliibacter sp. MBI-7]